MTEDDREADLRHRAPPSDARGGLTRPTGTDRQRPAPRTERARDAPVPPERRGARGPAAPLSDRASTSVAVAVAVAVTVPRRPRLGSFFSTTRVSVVSTIDAIDAALRSAERVTLTGSMTPSRDAGRRTRRWRR